MKAMQVFDLTLESIENGAPDELKGAVLAIGNFDGCHMGHSALLEVARKRALDGGKKLAVLTFEPHPRRLFRADDAPFTITPLPLKLERLKKSKVDIAFILHFNWDFAKWSADDFITRLLKHALGVGDIVVGSDFHFGQNRQGNIETLKAANLHCTAVGLVMDYAHAPYSSSRIRGLLQAGHIDEANKLLGWAWEIRGEVIHGDKRGRTIGYPTANVALGETIHPAYGIYAGKVKWDGEEQWHKAAINIGIRPMFETKTALLEAYIFDFSGDLYGQTLHISLDKKIRDEAKFAVLAELIEQIGKDCEEIKQFYRQIEA